MSTLVRTELGRDQRGNKFQTNVYESFTTMTPDTAASSWSLTQADGVFTLTETYTEQVPDPGGGGGTTYPDIWSLDITTSSEPIETNQTFRNFMSLTEMAQWTAWKQGREPGPTTYPSGFPASSGNDVVQELYQRFNRGETDYLAPRTVLKLQKVYSVAPSLAGVGYASGTPDGCPFTVPSGVNWLFTGAHSVTEGANYRVTKEWLSSSNGPWDSYIYGGE
jgi:hypothetical protein